jgi:hypothetical protein
MKLSLLRLEQDGYATRGQLVIDGAPSGFILEPAGPGGVTGRARIPAGRYALELKPLGTSKFDAAAAAIMAKAGGKHLGMLRLVDVPGRSEILLHWGNFWRDSDGCLLIGTARMAAQDGTLAVSSSQEAYAKRYPAIARAALNLDASIDVRDSFVGGPA